MSEIKRICRIFVYPLIMIFIITSSSCVNLKKKPVSKETIESRIVLTFWHPNAAEINYDSFVLNEFKKELNIDIKFETLPENKEEYLNLRILSGDIPDMFNDLSFSQYYKYIDQNILAVVPIELMKKYCPRLINWFEKNQKEKYVWNYYIHNGKNYAVPSLWTIGSNAIGLGYREDWLEDISVFSTPRTIEELETCFEKIKVRKHIYPLSSVKLRDFNFVFGAYNCYPNIFVNRDNKVVRGEILPAAKEALIVLNRWYELGYIDPEFIINKQENIEEKWFNNEVGFVQYFWWCFCPQGMSTNGSYKKLEQLNSKAKVNIMPLPKGPNGYSGTNQISPIRTGVQFGRQLNYENDKLIKYLQLFDLAFDYDWLELVYKGVKDETFTYSPIEGYQFISPYDQEINRTKFGIWLPLLSMFNDYDLQTNLNTAPKYKDLLQDCKNKMVNSGEYDVLSPVYKPIYDNLNKDVTKYTEKNFIKFIIGERPISEFDEFVIEWKEKGGDKILEEAQIKYNELCK